MRTVKGYVDRIEDGIVVFMLEDDSTILHIEKTKVNKDLDESDWVLITLNEIDDIIDVVYDAKETKQRAGNIKALKNKLKRRD